MKSPLSNGSLEKQVDRLKESFLSFVQAQATSSGVLLAALLGAVVMVNLGYQDLYQSLRALPVGFHLGELRVSESLLDWTNDALIAVFFFLIGLEIKREVLAGELRPPERRLMLVAAAAGGMVAPALIYVAFNLTHPQGDPAGWGIPMATDTALAIGVLAAFGNRLPRGVTAFLVGLAIVDDIGAVLVIAVFYTHDLHLTSLLWVTPVLAGMALANAAGVRHPSIYLLGGVLTWIGMHHSGVHASIAGVLAAATVPARGRVPPNVLARRLSWLSSHIQPRVDVLGDADSHARIHQVEDEARRALTPLRRWEDGLELPVALFILPLFAFLNAGVPLEWAQLRTLPTDPVALGIVFGLVVGKPVGIALATWLALRSGWGQLPRGIDLGHVVGAGLLAGVGFTMSTFIANLALSPARLDDAKVAILCASLAAGIVGFFVLGRRAA
jgi:NhaA family Na+:H+ antiporter